MPTVVFTPDAIKLVRVYAPFQDEIRHHWRFVLTLHSDLVPLTSDVLPYVNQRADTLSFSSSKRPPVNTLGSIGPLLLATSICDAQNKTRDSIFKWCRLVTVFATPYRFRAHWGPMAGHNMEALALDSITVQLDEERIPS